jgi:hypothetical protein
VAYSLRKTKTLAESWVNELSAWTQSEKERGVQADRAVLFAQVMNSLNLVHLQSSNLAELNANMTYLMEEVVPKISNEDQRAHIEGNAYYQKSILARKAGNTHRSMLM